MFTWIADYWYLCLIALLIGIATGWWIWAHARAAVPVVRPDINLGRPSLAPVTAPSVPVGFVANGPRIAAAVGEPDDLELIKGVGPTLGALLHRLGVQRFDQIAAWGPHEVAEVDGHLGSFRGRIDRDSWVDQAGYLARGDVAGFEAKYGGLGSEKA